MRFIVLLISFILISECILVEISIASSQEELVVACVVLYESAREAAMNNREAEQFTYTSAFNYLKNKVTNRADIKQYINWFDSLTLMNPDYKGAYLLTLNAPPKKIGRVGGWYHMEKQGIMDMMGRGTVDTFTIDNLVPFGEGAPFIFNRQQYKNINDALIWQLLPSGRLPQGMDEISP